MINKRMVIFMLASAVFAATHYVAMMASLYWYYWWFDSVMHFWGGTLLGLGVYTFSSFKWLHIVPSLKVVLLVLFLATISWEVFEWFVGLYDPKTHTLDTIKDIFLGFSGGLLAHYLLQQDTID